MNELGITVDSSLPAEEAARWFLRLQNSVASDGAFMEWQKWLNASHENREAYEAIEDTALRLGRVSFVPDLPSAEELALDTYDGALPIAEWKRSRESAGVVPYLPPRSRSTWGTKWSRPLTIAAGLSAIVLLGGVIWRQHQAASQPTILSYRTAHGERQIIELPEHSTVTLDADSALEVRLTPQRRSLELTRGEAYFEVSKDPHRPFVVSTGRTQVTAVGTAFDVRLSDDRTVVAVTEGKVNFVVVPKSSATRDTTRPLSAQSHLATQVAAGEVASYRDDGTLQTLPTKEASLATGWLEGRRQYRDEPLRYVLADVDRYSGKHIEFADEAAGDLRFTGTLDLKNSDAWLRGLSVALPVQVTQKGDTLSIALRIAR